MTKKNFASREKQKSINEIVDPPGADTEKADAFPVAKLRCCTQRAKIVGRRPPMRYSASKFSEGKGTKKKGNDKEKTIIFFRGVCFLRKSRGMRMLRQY